MERKLHCMFDNLLFGLNDAKKIVQKDNQDFYLFY